MPFTGKYSYVNNIHFENQNNNFDISDKKKRQTFIENHTLAVRLFLSHGRRRVFEYSIRERGGAVDSAGLERTARAGFRFRRDFSGCPNACVRESSVFFHVLTTILQALGWGTFRALLLSRGIPRGCWGTAPHPRGGGGRGRGERKKIMQDAPGGWERKKRR